VIGEATIDRRHCCGAVQKLRDILRWLTSPRLACVQGAARSAALAAASLAARARSVANAPTSSSLTYRAFASASSARHFSSRARRLRSGSRRCHGKRDDRKNRMGNAEKLRTPVHSRYDINKFCCGERVVSISKPRCGGRNPVKALRRGGAPGVLGRDEISPDGRGHLIEQFSSVDRRYATGRLKAASKCCRQPRLYDNRLIQLPQPTLAIRQLKLGFTKSHQPAIGAHSQPPPEANPY
jgi:hypothetical protein